MLRKIATFGLFFCLGVLASTIMAAEPVETLYRWSNKRSDKSLRKLAPKSGFITDAKTWGKLCKAWRPGRDVSKVNFKEELILVGTVSGPNRVTMKPMIHDDGDLRFVVGGSKKGGPGFGYLLLRIKRDGVKSVNGNPVKGNSKAEYFNVEILGRLNVGVVAIGGETTGTTVTVNRTSWELDLKKNAQWPKMAGKLNGKRVIVKGRLERLAGVEIKERWIVIVTSFQFADDAPVPKQ